MSYSGGLLLTGFAGGLRDATEKSRRNRIEDEERAEAKQDRQRVRDRQDKVWGQQDTDRERRIADEMDDDSLAIVDRARGFRREKRQEMAEDEDRALRRRATGVQIDAAESGLADAKVKRGREAVAWQHDQQALKRKMQEEGMEDLIRALESGVPPGQAEARFNGNGELQMKPGSLVYDPNTKNVRFSGTGGAIFDGSIDHLKKLFVEPKAPIKLGKDDRLLDPTTKEEVVPAASAAGGDDDFTKWNRQTASRQAAEVVRQGLGLTFDSELKQWMIPDGMSEKVSQATALAGQITRHFNARITPEEAGAMALAAAKKLPTYGEARDAIMREPSQNGVPRSDAEIKAAIEQHMRQARIAAAQELNLQIQDKEMEIEQREAAADGGGLGDARRPAAPGGTTAPQPAAPQAQPAPAAPQQATLPPAAASKLKEGVRTKFGNGQVWTLRNGQPVQVQ